MNHSDQRSGYELVRPAKSAPPAAGGAAIQLQVVGLERDRLACKKFADGGSGAETIYVALPWWLRRTPHDGTTRNGLQYAYIDESNRTATRLMDERIQDEAIVPTYLAGDILYAIKVDHTDVTGPDGTELTLLDSNVDGRVWAEI